ncbi:hypothetical protein G7Y89_g10324 [Cudoniella acicularis]|uniref:Uncharacterized protein n=1 Tax=Cudoniella acicularis TaxID=354080 RepID=A0A8H4RFS1_9HELO|nr:hypothetical protein G7Y89_g10324 [Cudoniella acicularis]
MLEHHHKHRFLTAASYVDLDDVYSVRWEDLHVYAKKQEPNGALFRLDKESFTYVWERMNRCVGLEAMETWVPTKQLREDFARRYIRVRDGEQNTSTRVKRRETTATTTTGAYDEIYSFILVLLRLVPTIVPIVVRALFNQLRHSAGPAATALSGGGTTTTTATGPDDVLELLLPQVLTRTHVGAVTPEGTTTREGIHAATGTYVLYLTVWPLFCRSVRQSQGARSRGLLDLVPAVLGVFFFLRRLSWSPREASRRDVVANPSGCVDGT